jgi:hypothetical protein
MPLLTVLYSATINILDIVQSPVLSLKTRRFGTAFCLHFQVVPTRLGPIDSSVAQVSRFRLKTETKSNLGIVVFFKEKTGRRIVFRILMVALLYQRHKPKVL